MDHFTPLDLGHSSAYIKHPLLISETQTVGGVIERIGRFYMYSTLTLRSGLYVHMVSDIGSPPSSGAKHDLFNTPQQHFNINK